MELGCKVKHGLQFKVGKCILKDHGKTNIFFHHNWLVIICSTNVKKKKSNFPSNLALHKIINVHSQNLLNYLNKLHNYLLDHVKSLISQFINTSWCFQQTHLVFKSLPLPASPLIIELSTKKKRVDHMTKNTSKYSFVIMY